MMNKILKLLCVVTLLLTISCDRSVPTYGSIHAEMYYMGNNPENNDSGWVMLYDMSYWNRISMVVSQLQEAAMSGDFNEYGNITFSSLQDVLSGSIASINTRHDMTFQQREAGKEYIVLAGCKVYYTYYDIDTNAEIQRISLNCYQYKTIKVEAGTTVNTTFVFQDYSSNIRL